MVKKNSVNYSKEDIRLLMKKIIHVNQQKIRNNKKTGSNDPVIHVKTYKEDEYLNYVTSELIYSPDKPLSCGARCWIETKADVDVNGKIL